MKALLDTHIWVWWLTGNPALTTRERTALDTAATAGELFLAAISLWEAQMLHARKRFALPLPFADWLPRAAAPAVVTVLPRMCRSLSRWKSSPGASTAIRPTA